MQLIGYASSRVSCADWPAASAGWPRLQAGRPHLHACTAHLLMYADSSHSECARNRPLAKLPTSRPSEGNARKQGAAAVNPFKPALIAARPSETLAEWERDVAAHKGRKKRHLQQILHPPWAVPRSPRCVSRCEPLPPSTLKNSLHALALATHIFALLLGTHTHSKAALPTPQFHLRAPPCLGNAPFYHRASQGLANSASSPQNTARPCQSSYFILGHHQALPYPAILPLVNTKPRHPYSPRGVARPFQFP
eukprot:356623-Chlamydomonas_euryale.AAC.2